MLQEVGSGENIPVLYAVLHIRNLRVKLLHQPCNVLVYYYKWPLPTRSLYSSGAYSMGKHQSPLDCPALIMRSSNSCVFDIQAACRRPEIIPWAPVRVAMLMIWVGWQCFDRWAIPSRTCPQSRWSYMWVTLATYLQVLVVLRRQYYWSLPICHCSRWLHHRYGMRLSQ